METKFTTENKFKMQNLTQNNPTDVAAPNNLGLFASLTAPRNPI